MEKNQYLINTLQVKRDIVRNKIRTFKKKNKNAILYVREYNRILKELEELGFKAKNTRDYLTEKYWENHTGIPEKVQWKKDGKMSVKVKIPTEKPVKKDASLRAQNNIYIINMAWTGENDAYKMVENYFNELNIKQLPGDDGRAHEHIIKYEFKGTEDAFNILKKSAQFVADHFSINNDIAIYGKIKP